MRCFLITVVLSLFAAGSAMAATFTVDDLGDAGDANSADNVCLTAGGVCTLRAAIEQANAGSGLDSILFGVAGTIAPAAAYPPLSAAIEIDGRTAPGYADAPVVVIAGGGMVTFGFVFEDGSDSSSIAGLEISGFITVGIAIESDNVTVTRCFLGPVSGGLPNGNGISVRQPAFGTVITDGNVISGNSVDGIFIVGDDTTVSGNRVGTDPTGMTALANGSVGIRLLPSADGTEIGALDPAEGNLISGNGNEGIRIQTSTDTSIFGNLIGTDATGAAALGNISNGIGVYSSTNTRIGRMDAPNVISGNLTGVLSEFDFGTIFEGNIIGLDSSRTTAIPNRGDGVFLFGGDGIAAGGNLISGNTVAGIYIVSVTASIANNTIGLNGSGDAVPNGTYGIEIDTPIPVPKRSIVRETIEIGGLPVTLADTAGLRESADLVEGIAQVTGTAGSLIIGGTSPGEGNTISGNSRGGIFASNSSRIQIYGNTIGMTPDRTAIRGNEGPGITLASAFPFNGFTFSGNSIFGNSIFGNQGLGIDLGGTYLSPGDGVTANDPDDVDDGANGLQNYPVITAATSSGAASSIQGTLNSTPDLTYSLHFYASTVADPSGFGEGETYLGTMDVATDAGGDTAFVFNGPPIAPGSVVTATATYAGSTSEFSAAVLVTALGAASTVQFSGAPYAVAESAGSVTITVTRTGDLSAPATVAYATADDTATAGSDYTAASGTLTFAPTVASQTFTVPILDDGSDEPAELITLTLSNPAGTTLGTPSSTTITIADDDDAPAPTAAIPTTSEWGLFLLAATLALLGLAGLTGWRS